MSGRKARWASPHGRAADVGQVSRGHAATTADQVSTPGFEIADEQVLQVVYDPLRFRLLRLTAGTPRSVAELAEQVGVPRGRLYYHVNLLLEHKVLAIVEERPSGTRVERYYRAVHSSYRLSPGLRGHPLAQSHAPLISALQDLVDVHLDAVAAGIQDLEDSRGHTLLLSQEARLTSARMEEFSGRAVKLINEFFGEGAPRACEGENAGWYTTLLLLTPLAAPFGQDHRIALQLDHENPDAG